MRKMILGFAVAIMLMAASAQAQGAVWSATFTPGDINGYAFGCRNGDDDAECSNKDVLSDDTFTVGEIVYTVTEFYQTSGTNRLYFAGIRTPEDGTSWVDIADELKIGSTSLDIGDAFLSQGQNNTSAWRLRWSGDPGLDDVLGGDSLTDGTSISVTLISGDLPPPPPTTPGAPTGLAATANGPSQIDLAWTAPASTGGSAITGYKIEVSPDGSSWSDLVADTGSTDTAYAHMGLDPAATRHYRVSAINAVGTSNASDSDDTTTASTNTAPTGAPTITGTAEVGETLTASTTGIADADGLTSPTYTYQWIRVDGTEADIAGENSSTYTLVDADLGTTLKVKVSFDDDLGHTETLTSAATATVGAAATAPTVSTVAVTSMPASGDTYGTGEMIRFTVTFDQDVTVTGTPEFEFCLGNSDGGSCTDGSPPPTRRRAALSSGSGTTALVFSYTVVAGEMDDNGIWIGDQDRTIKLDTGDAIEGTVGGLDAVLTHAEEDTQPGHKVNGEATDRAALVALYNATSGPNWTINTNWLTTAALSEWYGVTTDVDGRVTHVYLAQNELNGEIPVELGDLTNLQILYLAQNMLSGAIPAALGDLTNLRQLYLNQNMLSGEIPAELGDLASLQILYLWGNELSGEIPAALGDLTNLEQLSLAQNGLSGEIPAELGDLSSLQILYLWGNELSGAIPVELGDLTNLEQLSLSQNMLSGEIPAALGDLASLQILDIWGNELSGAIPVELGDLTNLEQLSLSQNMLSGAIPAALGDLASLQILDISQNELSGAIPAKLGDLASLQILYLAQNELSGAIPAEMGDLASLQQLYLNGNTDLAGPLPLTLSALSQLSVLDIRETTLCAPVDTAFQAWLATINFQGVVCGTPPPPPPPPPPLASNFPTADAGPDQLGVWEGALVTLDGSGSSDPDDDPLRYRWNQLSGEPVVLSSQNVVNPTFTAPEGLTVDAVLRFRLLVTDPSGRFDSDTVTVTVDPEAEPPPAEDWTYYFPHLAVGAGWQTTITYINYSPQEVSCRTEFLADQGTPLMVSFAGRGTVVSLTDVLPPGGSVHQETNVDLSAPLARGWARGTCSGPLKASLLFRWYNSEGMPVAEAGVNAATVPATRFVTFAEQGEGQQGSGVAYANPFDTAALVTFTVRDAAGEVLAIEDLMLPPNGHGAQNMPPLFGLPSFSGSLEVTSTEPIVSLSLNFEAASVFSSLPPGELDAAAQGSTTYYFTHLAVGASWQTTITYINYSPQEVTCQTDFLSDHGSPLMVSFAGRGTVISRTDVLPPGGSVHQETNVDLSAPLARGWARATCSGPLKASLLYRRRNSEGVPTGEAGVNATTVPATRFVTFAEQGEGKYGSGVAYANPSDTAALITFTARDADGGMLASVDRTLLPGGHDAQNMAPLFGLSSFTGSLEVTSTAPIVSLSLNFEAAPVFSSLPPGELDAAAQ